MKWLRRIGAIVLIFGIPLLIVRREQVWWWIEVHTGTVNEPGPYYGFFSGFGSDLGEYAILTAVAHGVYLHWSHINCHEPRCLWVGKYPAADGAFKYCHRHHPDFGGKPPTREHIHQRHSEHHGHRSGHPDAPERTPP